MRARFNTITLVLIALAITINIVLGAVINKLIPLYLDSIGTVLVGALVGPIAGAVTGALANVIWSFYLGDPSIAYFAPVAALIGLIAGMAGRRGRLRRWYGALAAGLVTGIVAASAGALIVIYQFGGLTGAATDAMIAFFMQYTNDQTQAVYLQSLLSDIADKSITYMVVWLIIRGLSRRLLARFPLGEQYIVRRVPLIGRVK